MDWLILDNFIFGFNKKILQNIPNIQNIYLFDLDGTLIKTKSNKKFPIDKNDWDFLYPNIPNKINSLSNCFIGIITNQKGLKNKEMINNWIIKIKNILLEINIDFVFVSLKDDRFRKPMIGSWEYIYDKIFFQTSNINDILLNKIYYIGDAFGRKNDFSDTDLKFAINCKFKSKTPEIFFGILKKDLEGSIKYPIIEYYNINQQSKIFKILDKLIKNNDKILIMLIGFPASGKSFLRNEILKRWCQFKYYNNDDINSKEINDKLINKNPENYSYVIDDNTNTNMDKRINILKKYNSHTKIAIYFNYSLEICFHLNYMRMYWFGKELVSKIVYNTLQKYFDKNNLNENFDYFIEINKLFNEFNFDDKIKYYF